MGDVQLFVVRVWQGARPFHASVRGADDEAPRLFDSPEQLAEFLRLAAEATGRSTGGPTGL
jgi:hypothetical protein